MKSVYKIKVGAEKKIVWDYEVEEYKFSFIWSWRMQNNELKKNYPLDLFDFSTMNLESQMRELTHKKSTWNRVDESK